MTSKQLEDELERLHPASFAWALGCCRRNREEAEDVLQSSYLKVLEGKARFDGHSSFKTFLFSVIRRTAAQSRRRAFLFEAWAGRRERRAEAEGVPDEPERRMLLAGALAKLSRRQREVLELVFQHGMTVEEAGEAMGVSVGTARVHYGRGKKRLLERLGEQRR